MIQIGLEQRRRGFGWRRYSQQWKNSEVLRDQMLSYALGPAVLTLLDCVKEDTGRAARIGAAEPSGCSPLPRVAMRYQ